MLNSRQWQVFVAPGEENKPLPLENSPWHDERWVQIPKEQWDLMVEFAESIDLDKAQKLEQYSWAIDNNQDDYIYVSTEELKSLVAFMDNLSQKIQSSGLPILQKTEEIVDEYVKEEYVCMLEAVAAVFKESLKLEKPFRAWVD